MFCCNTAPIMLKTLFLQNCWLYSAVVNISRFVYVDSCHLISFNDGHLYCDVIKGLIIVASFMACIISLQPSTAPRCRLPSEVLFYQGFLHVWQHNQPPPRKQGDYGAPRLVFENNQSGLWRDSLVIFPTRTAIRVASPCSCME